jgi:serine/threonine protein kinase
VLYELLSGRRAFHGENPVSTMAAILRDEHAPLDAPATLQAIVNRCLAKPPGQRYQTVADLREDLGRASHAGTPPHAPRPHLPPSIAVLSFANMGADREDEYFSDGLAEEINRASYLAAAGRVEEATNGYREILELNPSMVLAQFNLAGRHAFLGEWDRALPLCEEA